MDLLMAATLTVTLIWVPPVLREDDTTLDPGDISHYNIRFHNEDRTTTSPIRIDGNRIRIMLADHPRRCKSVQTVLKNLDVAPSKWSAPLCYSTIAPPPEDE